MSILLSLWGLERGGDPELLTLSYVHQGVPWERAMLLPAMKLNPPKSFFIPLGTSEKKSLPNESCWWGGYFIGCIH